MASSNMIELFALLTVCALLAFVIKVLLQITLLLKDILDKVTVMKTLVQMIAEPHMMDPEEMDRDWERHEYRHWQRGTDGARNPYVPARHADDTGPWVS